MNDINEKYIEEKLRNHRMNKTLLWSALIVTSGGTVSVFFKALSTKNPISEWIFVIIGFLLIYLFIKFIGEISSDISNLILYLKRKGGK